MYSVPDSDLIVCSQQQCDS